MTKKNKSGRNNILEKMSFDAQSQFEMVAIKKQSNVLSLEEQALCFIDFLNGDDYIENSNLENLYFQLVSLYHVAVYYRLSYKPSKRNYVSKCYVTELELRKPGGNQRLEDFIIHWGSNHCIDLIRAIQMKLKNDFRLHKCKYRDSLGK
jgi:hypothetical protein